MEKKTFDKQEFYRQYRDRLTQQLDSQGVRWWKPKVGTNVIRILPSWKGLESEFFKQVFVHWNIGENQKKVTCPSTPTAEHPQGRKDCPVCAYVEELYNSGIEEDVAEARKISRRERFACNILDRSGQTEGIAVYEMGPQLFRDILFMFTDGDYGELDNLKAGRDLKIVREGTGMTDTKYSAYPAANPSEVPEDVMNQLNDIDVIYTPPTVEAIETVMLGDAEEQTQVGAPAEAPDEVGGKQEFVETPPVEEKKEEAPPEPEPEKKEEEPKKEEEKKKAPKEETPPPTEAKEEVVPKSKQASRGAKLRERIQKLRDQRNK